MKNKCTSVCKSLETTCQICKKRIEIQYDKYHCNILERKLIAEKYRKNMPFPKTELVNIIGIDERDIRIVKGKELELDPKIIYQIND